MSENGGKRVCTIFHCYSHKDMHFSVQLEKHLSALKRTGYTITWSDREILAGENWMEKIDTNLSRADIVLLLLSPDFIDSDYCYSNEMFKALERHHSGKARVIPLLIRAVDYEETPVAELPVLPANGIPIAQASSADEAWRQVVREIRKAILSLPVNRTFEARRQRFNRWFLRSRKRLSWFTLGGLLFLLILFIGGEIFASLYQAASAQQVLSSASATRSAQATLTKHNLLGATQTSVVLLGEHAYANNLTANGMMEGFDAQHTDFNPFEQSLVPGNVAYLAHAWKYQAKDEFFTSPLVVNGIVYAGSIDGTFHALDAVTGGEIWTYFAGFLDTTPAFFGGHIYVSSNQSPDTLYELDAQTGQKLGAFSVDASEELAAPVIVNGIVYVVATFFSDTQYFRSIYALNASLDTIIWQYTTSETATSNWPSDALTVSDGVVYVNADKLYALDSQSGQLLWNSTLFSSYEVVVDGGLAYLVNGNTLFTVDAHSDELRWEYTDQQMADGVNGFTNLAVARGIIYLSSDNSISTLDAKTGKLLWKIQNGGRLVVAGDLIYLINSNGCYSLDARSGKQLWNTILDVTRTPTVANGWLYISSADHSLYAFTLPGKRGE